MWLKSLLWTIKHFHTYVKKWCLTVPNSINSELFYRITVLLYSELYLTAQKRVYNSVRLDCAAAVGRATVGITYISPKLFIEEGYRLVCEIQLRVNLKSGSRLQF